MRSRSIFRMQLGSSALALATVFQLCGCHKTVMVFGPSALPDALPPAATDQEKQSAAEKQLPGIPFYNHYGVCTQDTVWLEPQTTLTLTVTPEGGKPVTQTMTLNNLAFHDHDPALDPSLNANNLVASLKALQGPHEISSADSPYCPSVVAGHWQDIGKKYGVVPIDETPAGIEAARQQGNLVPISNTAEIGTAVDYSRVYYLNAKTPLTGTASVDAKLNSDGTLGEGSASVDDETLSTVLTTLGTLGSGGLTAWSTVKAASITGQATVSAAAATPQIAGATPVKPHCDAGGGWPAIPPNRKVTYDFAVEPGGFTHEHKLVTPLETLGKAGAKCDATRLIEDGNFTVSPVGGGGKPDKNAVTVSGTVTLPKGKDAKP